MLYSAISFAKKDLFIDKKMQWKMSQNSEQLAGNGGKDVFCDFDAVLGRETADGARRRCACAGLQCLSLRVTSVGRVSVAPPGKNTLDLTSAAFAAVVLNGRGQVILSVFSAITGVVIVQRFDAEFIGVEQVFQQLLHRHFS